VANFSNADKHADIMRGFGFLVPDACRQDIENCTHLIKEILKPLLLPCCEHVQSFIQARATGTGNVKSRNLVFL
jgi:hypothetical protein